VKRGERRYQAERKVEQRWPWSIAGHWGWATGATPGHFRKTHPGKKGRTAHRFANREDPIGRPIIPPNPREF
jgi:hypothetical protein